MISKNNSKTIIWSIVGIIILFFILFNILQSTPYYNQLPKEEQNYLKNLALDITKDQSSDISKVSALMNYVVKEIKHESPEGYDGSKEASHDPIEIIKRGWGLCYDRSYVFELMSESLGYKVRHVAITMHSGSHAVSEVKVNDKWVMFDTTNNQIHQLNEEYLSTEEIFNNPEIHQASGIKQYNQMIFGINSFHGYFAKPKIPYPDINVKQFLYNIEVLDKLPFGYGRFQTTLKTSLFGLIILILIITSFFFARKKYFKNNKTKKS